VRRAEESAESTATLAEVDVRSELSTRRPRLPDSEGLDRALAILAREMTENPRRMLQRLVETARELCRADTAGISLLEGDVFRWEAVAGVFASSRDGTMPRAASPCGVCIDENVTQLMHLPDRHFPALRAEPRFVEALLIPFRVRGRPVGTVWIVSHTDERKFDREDERVVQTLAQFAAAGWQLWNALAAAEEANHRKDEGSVEGLPPVVGKTERIPNPRRLLIVEDHPDVAESLALILRRDDHEVRIAHDGPAALQVLSHFKPDVVLLDVGLSGMDGYQVARRMREEALESKLTIIALSGYDQMEDHRRSMQAGCDAHLVKPVHPNVLRSILGAETLRLSST
jgi:CheY-like chemotaxis protein